MFTRSLELRVSPGAGTWGLIEFFRGNLDGLNFEWWRSWMNCVSINVCPPNCNFKSFFDLTIMQVIDNNLQRTFLFSWSFPRDDDNSISRGTNLNLCHVKWNLSNFNKVLYEGDANIIWKIIAIAGSSRKSRFGECHNFLRLFAYHRCECEYRAPTVKRGKLMCAFGT